jgi:dTDP-3-amino-3,4,6-trideoxy-alpha-D-glucose transaminase
VTSVPFLDLSRETTRLRSELEEAIARVLASGRYVLSDEVATFEAAFADYCGAKQAIGVASGTDAITIALAAVGVAPGDEVITAPNTCIPTIVGIERAGAVPVLADVDPVTYTLDPEQVERRVTGRTRAILPVHLYGQPADLADLAGIADRRGIALVEDCAQAHGARFAGRRAGSVGIASAFSFYPTKNLGALGDAGAVVTSDDAVADRARLLRNYGERARFEHVLHGLNSRLDSLQAAVLAAKLPHLEAANDRRRELASVYADRLAGAAVVAPPVPTEVAQPVFHLYVVQADERDELREELARRQIRTAVHYPTPVHHQPAYRELDVRGGFPVAETLARRIVSLPISADHSTSEIEAVATAIRQSASR